MCLCLPCGISIAAISYYVITAVSTSTRDVIDIYIMHLQFEFALSVWVRNKGRRKRRGITWCSFFAIDVISQLDSELLQLETCVAIGEEKIVRVKKCSFNILFPLTQSPEE